MSEFEIHLPSKAPDGFCWRWEGGDDFSLQPTQPATLYKIMVGSRYHCGYYKRELAEMFLPEYQRQYPDEVVTIQEEASECPVPEVYA